MFKRFLNGLIFGSGFAIALLAILYFGLQIIFPGVNGSSDRVPEFSNAQKAEVIEQEERVVSIENSVRDFKLYNDTRPKMEVSSGGGIFSIATVFTPPENLKPNTYQLWITENDFWQIRTIGDEVEVELLEYPLIAPVDAVQATMRKQVGSAQSTMTVSSEEIASLQLGHGSWHDQDMNGKMKITNNKIVFFMPNKY
ncbi:hypothetical protein H4J38_09195 [Colwellia sp. BRX10-3]|uniref:hypothetical protein n=1 Tax=Colwellia sp. BRX10-3 TaxID=2759844 RepID=UPI0015F37E34|nr:hypothetical protein [Colwellia sp. BRX10-3]MBA6390947.1 hypothetical protein [Colwellia sp. BRX10-3]